MLSFGRSPQPQQSQQPQQPQQGQYPSSLYPQIPGPPQQPQQQLQPWSQSQQYAGPSQSGPVQQYQQTTQPGQVQGYSGPGQPAQAGWGVQRSYYSAPPSQLGPQPLESVDPNEDPLYGPLGRARRKVERGLIADDEISPDLESALQGAANERELYPPLPSNNHAFRPLKTVRNCPLPDALHQEINYKHISVKMGLFEEIERAWFVVDNKLFLWDYSDGRDFNRYDEQADTIQSVGLVKARRDVFVDDVTHILIICTSSRVTLLGLSRPSPHELNLYVTNLSADLPVAMEQIAGTTAGRVFMRGSNKDLYELEYSNESGWFFGSGAKVSVTNRSSGSIGLPLPSFLRGNGGTEGVESFVIDTVQSRLFTLRTKDEIEWFDIKGTDFISKGKYTRLKNDLIQRNLAGQAPGFAGARIVSIAVVGRHESRNIGLVAIAANGTRIYFNCTFSFVPSYFRAPPAAGIVFSDTTLYSSGTILGVQRDTTSPTASTQLHVITPNIGRLSASKENYENNEMAVLQEHHVIETIPSEVWTVVEVPSTNPANTPPSLRKTSDLITLNLLSRQATTEPRTFLILTTTGLSIAVQPRPIDVLTADLELEKDTAIATISHAFGKTQLTAMGVIMGAQSDLKQGDSGNYVQSILLNAGTPLVKESPTGRFISYSARHDGLALTLARFLRPIWNSRVTAPIIGGRQVLGVTESTLLAVQGRLDQLRHYLEEHPFPRVRAEGEHKAAWDQEELSLHGLNGLVKQAIEAIAFVLLLSDYRISNIIAMCDPNTQQTLANLTFKDLFTSGDARAVAKTLVTTLMTQQIGQELGIDTLSEILQARCGSFYPPGDVRAHKAEESMRRAETSRDPIERNEALNEALQLFSRAAGSAGMGVAKIQDVTRRFRAQQYVPGAVELALKCALELDPQNKAEDFDRDGRHPGDQRKQFWEMRRSCYECVIETLAMFDEILEKSAAEGSTSGAVAKRDEAYLLAINSDDRLFHFFLYDWHNERGLQERLLEFDTPYIEEYLKKTQNDVEERRDLLWKYYARREDFLAAARALHDLAVRPSYMALSDRSYYLAQSLTSAKSAASLGSDDVEFMSMVQERMDVAQVQMEVAREVERHPDMTRQEKDEQLERLNAGLLGLDELYQDFARPFRLYEPILLILKTADTRLDDVCEAVWRQLLQNASGTPIHDAMAEVITDLCRKYFPSEAAPLDIILPVVYTEAAPLTALASAGWATESLLEGGVPLRECWEAVMMLHDQAQTEEDREFYTEEAGVLAEKWTGDHDSIPLADVERFVSAYLLRATSATDVSERRVRTRERMGKAKASIGRW